jgi:hypothetical protein
MSGRTKTTLASSWNNQTTKPIRVPVIFASEVMQYARDLDAGNKGTTEKLLDEFIEVKRRQSLRLPRRFFTMDSMQWSVFNEFRRWLSFRKQV